VAAALLTWRSRPARSVIAMPIGAWSNPARNRCSADRRATPRPARATLAQRPRSRGGSASRPRPRGGG
jgi:hypothetical protein